MRNMYGKGRRRKNPNLTRTRECLSDRLTCFPSSHQQQQQQQQQGGGSGVAVVGDSSSSSGGEDVEEDSSSEEDEEEEEEEGGAVGDIRQLKVTVGSPINCSMHGGKF